MLFTLLPFCARRNWMRSPDDPSFRGILHVIERTCVASAPGSRLAGPWWPTAQGVKLQWMAKAESVSYSPGDRNKGPSWVGSSGGNFICRHQGARNCGKETGGFKQLCCLPFSGCEERRLLILRRFPTLLWPNEDLRQTTLHYQHLLLMLAFQPLTFHCILTCTWYCEVSCIMTLELEYFFLCSAKKRRDLHCSGCLSVY